MSATLDLAKHLIACNATIVLDDSAPTVPFQKKKKKLFNTQNIRLKAKLDAFFKYYGPSVAGVVANAGRDLLPEYR